MSIRTDVRSEDRSVAICYRMSEAKRAALRARAAEAGFAHVQDWLDSMLFGESRARTDAQEALPMTG